MPTPTEPVTDTGVSGQAIVDYAKKFLGRPYQWGAEGPDRFDCSGLVEYVYKHFGLKTPRTTAEMQRSVGGLKEISESQLQPGDLVLSKGWSSPGQGHVGIYAGGGKIVEAGDPVQITTLGPSYRAHVTGYRRVPGVSGHGAPSGSSPGVGIPGIVQSWFAAPANVTEAMGNIGEAMLGIARGAAEAGQLAGTVSRALLPSNLLRGTLLVMGLLFIIVGIWFIALEAKDA